ncbi:MAG: hypothetical protein ACRDEA_04175 [Microcystaceae cyanobacterium]
MAGSIPTEGLLELIQRLERLPPRSSVRRILIQEAAQLYGVSEDTILKRSAKQLALPGKSGAVQDETPKGKIIEFPRVSFIDPDPFCEFFFKSVIAAKKAIADYLRKPRR